MPDLSGCVSDHRSTVIFMPPLRVPVNRPGGRPRWLTIGSVRLAVLCGFIVLIGMLPGRLSPAKAGWVGWTGLAVLAAATVAAVVGVRRLTEHVPATALPAKLRGYIGLVGLGAAFFLFWTFVYLTLWWRHPGDAFTGIGKAPRFADFFYYSVSTSLISPPGDIIAHSRGARAATMIEMLTGFALLAAYLTSFIDWGRRDDAVSK
jgi:hypothetical protein